MATLAKLAKTKTEKAKNFSWKYFGAMMMETKNGQQAMSYTRFLGIVLFFTCLAIWSASTFMEAPKGGTAMDVPQGMLYTLWGLIGIKGGKDIAGALGKK